MLTPPSRSFRLLMLGAANSPHVEHLAASLSVRSVEVHVAGYVSPSLPPPDQAAGQRIVHLMPSRSLSRTGMPFHLVWLRRLITRLNPDIVHAHGVTMFGFTAAVMRARPLVLGAWGSDVLGISRRLERQARFAIARADAVTGDSPMLLERLMAMGAEAERTHLIGWGVDTRRFSPDPTREAARARLGLPVSPRLVLSARALAPIYNVPVIVAAFERLADEADDVELIVKHPGIGEVDGPWRSSRHARRIHILGNVPYERLADVYRAADVCVSVPSSDSAPRTVWESMACGTPSIVSDLPWTKHMIAPGKDALLCAIEPAAVARAISRVLRDTALATTLARRGRGLVQREHDRDVHLTRLVALYKRLAVA